MAAENWGTDTPLADALFAEPYRFDFFQAVRLLERLNPDRQAVGRDSVPAREAVHFRTRVSLSFPPSAVHRISHEAPRDDVERPPQMVVSFMGLTGPMGVLPNYYTELLAERTRYKDTALWEFLDIFNHRMISLFYRAWEKYRFTVAYERGEKDRLTEYLFSLIGMGTGGLHGRMGLPDEGLLLYSGLIAQRPHSNPALEAILSDYFGVSVRVQPFSGQWLKLDASSLTRVGTANSALGVSTIAGARLWDRQSKFRLQYGPLTLEEFKAFLPVGSAYKPMTALTRFLAGMEFDFDAQLVLKAADVPRCVLRTGQEPMLGWTSWLKTRDFVQDDAQVVLSAQH